MAFIEINGAQIYYATFGEDRSDRAPIVLIHGSTGTGQSNWQFVAPLLAREYRVIVPDCRGHGQSANPHHSYSFKEMADDTAALVRALGYERAHIIGHSNGGNVALVTLIEHPEIVQTAIPQAANAYVSPDLIEKEPAIFDPDRVARERPEWMNEMIALHGAAHGTEYWRDLLRLTLHAIITEPNYTPDDLARVRRPTLVIQGAQDRVNAPMRHAQFIARHIPDAEYWIPAGIGHNVHDELLFDWITRVLDFLARRGDAGNDALYRLRRAQYDPRVAVFDVNATRRDESIVLTGEVLTREQLQVARSVISTNVFREEKSPSDDGTISRCAPNDSQVDSSNLKILLIEATPCAIVIRAVADVRREPRSLAERMTQARFGEIVRILEERDDWVRVQLERDGYIGWTQVVTLHRADAKILREYAASCNALVQGEIVSAYTDAARTIQVGKLPFAISLPMIEQRDDNAAICLPDGRVWWVTQDSLLPGAERPRANAAGIAFTLGLIRRFVGVPYLWGGRTPFGFDCSGLAQTFYEFIGVAIPRDADQQFRAGTPVEGTPTPGDLLFFGEASELSERYERITHVAISLGGDEFVHANGTARGTSYNSFDPAAPNYRAWLREHFVGARRY
ncbi:MAG: alpha/beta fold hydrolase [Chloroflexi bacterium]|nr:alpha/beta fold hydrolase [Chloroflexota bacterium]